jgi:hypothetical protein
MDDTVEKKVKQSAREVPGREAVEGLRVCQSKILSATQANINAMFEYAQEALNAKSMPELVEISTAHFRRQLEMMTEQGREIVGAGQKLAIESARPFTSGLTNPFGQVS